MIRIAAQRNHINNLIAARSVQGLIKVRLTEGETLQGIPMGRQQHYHTLSTAKNVKKQQSMLTLQKATTQTNPPKSNKAG
jgi:hypothetical protein